MRFNSTSMPRPPEWADASPDIRKPSPKPDRCVSRELSGSARPRHPDHRAEPKLPAILLPIGLRAGRRSYGFAVSGPGGQGGMPLGLVAVFLCMRITWLWRQRRSVRGSSRRQVRKIDQGSGFASDKFFRASTAPRNGEHRSRPRWLRPVTNYWTAPRDLSVRPAACASRKAEDNRAHARPPSLLTLGEDKAKLDRCCSRILPPDQA